MPGCRCRRAQFEFLPSRFPERRKHFKGLAGLVENIARGEDEGTGQAVQRHAQGGQGEGETPDPADDADIRRSAEAGRYVAALRARPAYERAKQRAARS